MSAPVLSQTRRNLEDELRRLQSAGYPTPSPPVPIDPGQEAQYWEQLFEAERVRLAKLFLLYRDLEAENVSLRRELEPPTNHTNRPPTTPTPTGPFRYGEYTLYERNLRTRKGNLRTFYFFSRRMPRSGTACALPAGYEVRVTRRSGLPVLARIGSRQRPASLGRRVRDRTTTRVPTAPDLRTSTYRPQCRALTAEGVQCSNPSRKGSGYCIAHRNYHPRTARGIRATSRTARRGGVKATDTMPRFRRTPDTLPTVRRS